MPKTIYTNSLDKAIQDLIGEQFLESAPKGWVPGFAHRPRDLDWFKTIPPELGRVGRERFSSPAGDYDPVLEVYKALRYLLRRPVRRNPLYPIR